MTPRTAEMLSSFSGHWLLIDPARTDRAACVTCGASVTEYAHHDDWTDGAGQACGTGIPACSLTEAGRKRLQAIAWPGATS